MAVKFISEKGPIDIDVSGDVPGKKEEGKKCTGEVGVTEEGWENMDGVVLRWVGSLPKRLRPH